MRLDEPVECASGSNPLLLYKILHLLFFPLVRILCALCLRVNKIIDMVLMWDLWNFSFFGRGDVSSTHSELCHFVSGSQAKHQVSSPTIMLLKILSASAIAIMSWQDVTRLSLCSGVKECGTKRAHNFLFPKFSFRIRRTTVLGMFKDSAIILDAIRWSFLTKSATEAIFYLSSSRFWTAISLLIFYQLPSISKSGIPPKNVWSVQSLNPISHLQQY